MNSYCVSLNKLAIWFLVKIWKTKISIKSYILSLLVGSSWQVLLLKHSSSLYVLICHDQMSVYQVSTSYGNFVQVFFLTYVAHNIPTARFVLP